MKNYCCVVVTYNRLELLKECILALEKQLLPFSKIFIVNNNSSDGTKSFLESLEGDLFDVFNLDENVGGAGGFYEGLRHFSALYDWCLLIDDDAILRENFLQELNRYVENDDFTDIEAFSGTVIVKNAIDVMHRRRISNNITLRAYPVSQSEYTNNYFEYDLSSFCGLFIKYTLKEKIGLPEKDFFIWYDDTEYSLRINKYSKMLNINSAKLEHKTDITPNTGFSWKSYYGYRNSFVTGLKHSSNKGIYIIYSFFRLSGIFVYYILKIFFTKHKKDSCYKLKAHFIAFFDGLSSNLGLSKLYYPGKKYD